MSAIFYETGGTQWWCKRCETTVRARKDGSGVCKCETSPSPWEPVCIKCVQIGRNRPYDKKKLGFRVWRLPFTTQRILSINLWWWVIDVPLSENG